MAALILVFSLALSLVACTQVPDPEQNIESLEAVAGAPEQPLAAEKFDVELHPDPIVEPLEDCAPVLVLTARGTGEPKKGQLLGPVAREIAGALEQDVETLDLDYPADTDINEGGTHGVRLLIDTLNVQAEQCPLQRFVLLGYSQGALVVGDALSSPELRLVGSTVGELTEEAAEQIAAVVLYGNPRFMTGESYDAGNYSDALSGILPRTQGSLEQFAERIRDYCVAGDFICQSSLELDEEGHVQYFENGMQQVGAEFAINRLLAVLLPASEQSVEPAPIHAQANSMSSR